MLKNKNDNETKILAIDLLNSFSAKFWTESIAFVGALWAQCAQSAPKKYVDQNKLLGVLWNYMHVGTSRTGNFYKEYESGIDIIIQSN